MARYGTYEGEWAPYVPVAKRRQQAAKKVKLLQKKGRVITPVVLEGRTIAQTFWGAAWCKHLESFSDFDNRLPRGRTYVRNGSVVDLQIAPGNITALVSGSTLYEVSIEIKPLSLKSWEDMIQQCSGQIDSLVGLLQGKLSPSVMKLITSKKSGLFPSPQQIQMDCSCPDGAGMCKHIAASLYGVGARLDQQPELLFVLRKVDHMELITKASKAKALSNKSKVAQVKGLDSTRLSDIFGIELEHEKH